MIVSLYGAVIPLLLFLGTTATMNEAEKKKMILKSQRRGLKSHVSRYLNVAKGLLDQGREADVEELANAHDKLEELQRRVSDLDNQIFALCDDDELEQEVNKATETDAIVLDMTIDLGNRKRQIEQEKEQGQVLQRSTSESVLTQISPNN